MGNASHFPLSQAGYGTLLIKRSCMRIRQHQRSLPSLPLLRSEISAVTNVFVSVAGQNDNLGDSVLRRGLLNAVRGPDTELHVHVGHNDASYLSAVGLRSGDTLYYSTRHWERALEISLFGGRRTVIAFNAGEIQLSTTKAHIGWRTVGRLLAAKMRGGGGVHSGFGVRSPQKGITRAARVALRACSIVSWRDAESQRATGVGELHADWAVGEGQTDDWLLNPETRGARSGLVISMRCDRPLPSDEWMATVQTYARTRNLTISVLSQVERDNDRARDIASRIGANTKLVLWTDSSHADHEALVRSIYRQSDVVVSDRLHALIIAATEGALPFGLTTATPEKLVRTLSAAGLPGVAFSSDDIEREEFLKRLEALDRHRDLLFSSFIDKRQDLRSFILRIRKLTSSDQH